MGALGSPRGLSALPVRPAVPIAICFIAGILLHTALPPAPVPYLILMAAALGAAILAVRRPLASSLFIGAAALLGGLLAAQHFAFYYARDNIAHYASEDPHPAWLELHIDQPPRVLTNPFDQRHALPPKQVTSATVLRVRTWDGWRDTSGEVLVQIGQPHPALAAGQTVRVLGMLQRPAPPMNPGQFDWAHYYREQRVLSSFSIPHASTIELLRADRVGPLGWAREKVRHLLALGFPADRALDHALLRALLVGDHDPQLRDVQEQFQHTGTSHHLAVSGMHVAVLGGFVFLLCRLLCLRPRWSVGISLAFVILYGAMALPQPPVMRAVALSAAVGLGLLMRRRQDRLQLLAAAAVVMLIYRPLDVYSAGFQLSFVCVLALMLFTRPMLDFFDSFKDRDMEVADSLRPPSLLRSMRKRMNRAVVFAFATGLVAWWASMPLIAYHFEQLNPWAIPFGIVLAPFVLVALVGGLLKVILTALWPGLAGTWALLAASPVSWMRHVVGWLATFPAADVPVPPPPVWLIVVYYALLLPALLPRDRAPRVSMRIVLLLARVASCLLLLWFPLQRRVEQIAPTGETRVTLLAVGAGQCAVVQPPSGRTVLVDAGSSSLADMVDKCLGPFLRHSRCTQIDSVFISHGDYDHVSGVEEIVAGYGVHDVLTGSTFLPHAPENPFDVQLLAALNRLERPPHILAVGDQAPLGTMTTIEILWPPRAAPPGLPANEGCMVVKLTHAGRSILFPGDIQDVAMRELLKDPSKLKSDVLIAAHHGSSERLTDAFVRAVDPAYVLSSNDRTLTSKQREFEAIVDGRTLLRTNRCGSITVVIDREGNLRVEPFLGQRTGGPRAGGDTER